jgi:Na+/H+-dicarboxylate symporter
MCIAAKYSWSFVYCVITLCVLICLLMYIVLLCVYYFSYRMLARNQYPEGPTTGHFGTSSFFVFPVSKSKC